MGKSMPVYDYLCEQCGPFTEMRPMAESGAAQACPECGEKAPRAFLSAPYCATMSTELRLAHATNERSASAPKLLSDSKRSHSSGCSCCSGRSLPARAERKTGAAKGFPGRRPWMLSH
jgi:putative FmdB family regulatory protein